MTPTRFRACLESIGWTQRGLADRLGLHETRTRRWASGRYEVPQNVADWLERLARCHDKAGLPGEMAGE
jgi:ribosome-binding protein aMBF1 (putative translation factor)